MTEIETYTLWGGRVVPFEDVISIDVPRAYETNGVDDLEITHRATRITLRSGEILWSSGSRKWYIENTSRPTPCYACGKYL